MKKLFLLAPLAAMMCITPAMAAKSDKMTFDQKLEKADTNNDGLISREEHSAMMNEYFTKVDENADGQINEQEFQAAMKEHKEKWKKDKDAKRDEEM